MSDTENTVTETTTQDAVDQTVTAVDAAIAKALARKAAKAEGTSVGASATPRPRATAEEKAARDAKRAEVLIARKAERDAKRAAAAATASRPAHLAKVEAAAANLGVLSEDAQLLFNEATTNLPAAMVTVLAAHLQHFNRANATLRALSSKLELGQRVTVTGGDARFIGKVGTLSKVARIRCLVKVDGLDKECYCFTSDVEVIPAESVEEPVADEAVAF